MDNLLLVSPKLEYEKEAIEYVNEFIENNSHVNGSAGLPR
jgi:predicted acetyltransferase